MWKIRQMLKGLMIAALISVSALTAVYGPGANGAADKEKMMVFILSGQSNMEGLGDPKMLPEAMNKEYKNVMFFQKKCGVDNQLPCDQWITLKPGKLFGPEIGFAEELSKAYPARKIGIVKVAQSGTDINHWLNGGLYKGLLDQLELAGKNTPFDVTGMVWMQGESDTMNADMAKAYAENLKKLVAMIRKDLKKPDLPFVYGRVALFVGKDKVRFPFVNEVRKAQQNLKLANTSMVDTDDLAHIGDFLHFNGVGQTELGKKFGAAMAELLKGGAASGKRKK